MSGLRRGESWRRVHDALARRIEANRYPPGTHLPPEQALAVFECLQVMREALWQLYGPQVQQAWRDQLRAGPMPDFDPDEPF